MKKMLNSKKGFKTIVTIFSLLFLVLTFVFFTFLFKQIGATDSPETQSYFNSIDTEYNLRAFLNSPSGIEPEEVDLFVGDHMTNAQLVARTCADKDSRQYAVLSSNINNYFSKIYGEKNNWRLELIYLNEEAGSSTYSLSSESFGTLNIDSALSIYSQYENLILSTDKSKLSRTKALYALNIRGSRIGMQVLPCIRDNEIVKLILINNEGKSSTDTILTK